MATFRYRARDAAGRLLDGEASGETAAAVAAQLLASGAAPLQIEALGDRSSRALQIPGLGERVTLADLMLFCRQMQSLVRAGIPLVRALRGLADSTRNPMMAATLREVVDSLNSGRDLATSLGRHPRVFPPLLINMVRVGENSGRLEEAFQRLYQYLGFERYTRDKVRTALRYPLIVLVVVAIAIGVIMGAVVPQFARIYASFSAQLPAITQFIIALSEGFAEYWALLLGMLAAALLTLRSLLGTQAGRYRWDALKLRMPVVGSIILRATLARFARGFAMIARAGVPLLEGLGLISRAVENEYVGAVIRRLRDSVERGESLSRAAQSSGLFTPLVLQMLAVGEETGRLDEMMEEVAEFYDREVQADVDSLGATIEPLLIVLVGGVVLVLALGVFLPMWDLAGAAMGRR